MLSYFPLILRSNDSLVSLADIASSRGITLGVAVQYSYIFGGDQRRKQILDSFKLIVPELELRMAALQPARGDWKPNIGKSMVSWAINQGLQVHLTTLIYDTADEITTPAWFQDLTTSEMQTAIQEHIQAALKFFGREIRSVDVVNECWLADGRLTPGPISGKFPDYIEFSFSAARDTCRRYGMSPVLYYNGMFHVALPTQPGGTTVFPEGEATKALELVKNGFADGIGLQCHLRTTPWNLDWYRELLYRCRQLSCKVRISELEVWCLAPADENWAALFRDQADCYAEFFSMALGYKDIIQDVTCWGLDDQRSWKAYLKPTFLDSEGMPKPAFYSIIDTLMYPWR